MQGTFIVGTGIFSWHAQERRSNRYGYFGLSESTSDEAVRAQASLDLATLRQFEGQRVVLHCKVQESRKSSHIGDLFLGVFPEQPAQGEIITLGCGVLRIDDNKIGLEPETYIGLEPETYRDELWLDPRLLYRLHDQTILLSIQAAGDLPCHPVPQIEPKEADGVLAVDEVSFQVRGGPMPRRICCAKVKPLGGGMFLISGYEQGERVQAIDEDEHDTN
jgi:hypothetical protein